MPKGYIFTDSPIVVKKAIDPMGKGARSIYRKAAEGMFPKKKGKPKWGTVVVGAMR
jgi:hypothetical protein